jgi:hypothetical protein
MVVRSICKKCRRRNIVSFRVEPKEAWHTVVLTVGGQFARPAPLLWPVALTGAASFKANSRCAEIAYAPRSVPEGLAGKSACQPLQSRVLCGFGQFLQNTVP